MPTRLGDPQVSGDLGSPSVTFAPDRSAVSLLFTQAEARAEAGAAQGPLQARRLDLQLDVNVDVDVDGGDAHAWQAVVDVRGAAHAPDTRSAALVWSRCADVQCLADASGLARCIVGGPPGGSIRLTVLILAQSAAAGAQALAQLDSIDIGLVRKAACKPRGSPGRRDG